MIVVEPRDTSPAPLTVEAVEAVDRAGMADAISDQPDHLRDALVRARSAEIPSLGSGREVLICGMGGSAMGGDLAIAAIGDRARRQIRVVRDYAIEPWVRDTVIVCASYSGNTEETLACYDAARAAGAPIIAITTGGELASRARVDGVPVMRLPTGLQPRAAVCYLVVAILYCAARCGAAPDLTLEISNAAATLRPLAREWGPKSPDDSASKSLARRLDGTLPVIYGAAQTVPVALRWKAQINENSKLPAFCGALPEMNHNEICAWQQSEPLCPMTAVFLEDRTQGARIQRRFERTAAAIGDAVTERVQAPGETPLARALALVMLGDFISLYMAVLRAVDPTPVEAIERFKSALAP